MTLPKTTKSARANRPGCLFKDAVMNDLSLDLTAPQTLALSPEQRACLLGELVDGVVKLGAEHQPVRVCGPKQRDRSGAELFDEFAQPKRLHGGLARKLSCRICCIHSHNLSNFYNILRRPAA